MDNFLTEDTRLDLISKHKKEINRRVADRIKAVLMSNSGWSNHEIADALLLSEDTIRKHVEDFVSINKLENNAGGSQDKFAASNINTDDLISHLENVTYTTTNEIIIYIQETYNITYTLSGIKSWLHKNNFSYKQPEPIPAKADLLLQEEFKIKYEELKQSLGLSDVILFGDGVHPSMNTKLSRGWIRTGVRKNIETTGSRTRVNVFGTINIDDMSLLAKDYQTINSDSICDFLIDIRKYYNSSNTIHLILDQGPYNKSKQTKEKAEGLNITLHYLPPYSPNLNPIERIWKVANEHVRNNVFFKSAKDFREKIMEFYDSTWDKIKLGLKSRINDNFQTFVR